MQSSSGKSARELVQLQSGFGSWVPAIRQREYFISRESTGTEVERTGKDLWSLCHCQLCSTILKRTLLIGSHSGNNHEPFANWHLHSGANPLFYISWRKNPDFCSAIGREPFQFPRICRFHWLIGWCRLWHGKFGKLPIFLTLISIAAKISRWPRAR